MHSVLLHLHPLSSVINAIKPPWWQLVLYLQIITFFIYIILFLTLVQCCNKKCLNGKTEWKNDVFAFIFCLTTMHLKFKFTCLLKWDNYKCKNKDMYLDINKYVYIAMVNIFRWLLNGFWESWRKVRNPTDSCSFPRCHGQSTKKINLPPLIDIKLLCPST